LAKDRGKNDKMTKYKYACQSILQKRGSCYPGFFLTGPVQIGFFQYICSYLYQLCQCSELLLLILKVAFNNILVTS